MSRSHLVFVYGTLKRGLGNSHLLETAKFKGDAFTIDAFRMFSAGFPILFFNDDGDPVAGEVYEVDDATLARLDQLEAEGRMYNRKEITVAYMDGYARETDIDHVNVYIGNDEYWTDLVGRAPYTTKNEHGELNWSPRG